MNDTEFEAWWSTAMGPNHLTEIQLVLVKTKAKIAWDASRSAATNPIRAAIDQELTRALVKFPTWPTDPLHALAVLGEEFGELTQAVLQSVYEPTKSTPDDVRTEAIQVAAMAMRFLASLDRYEYKRGDQHSQVIVEVKP